MLLLNYLIYVYTLITNLSIATMSRVKNTDEKKAEQYFLEVSDKIIKYFGTDALYSNQIDKFGKRIFGNKWGGVYDQNTINLEPGKYYVCNTSWAKKSPGFHWISIYVTPAGIVHMFDSFVRKGNKIMPKLTNRIKAKGDGVYYIGDKKGKKDITQSDDTFVCGPLSLAYLIVVRDMGVEMADLV